MVVNKKVLVTGADGQLGKCLRDYLSKENDSSYDFVFANKDDLDITDKEKVSSYFSIHKWDGVINCAAYTAVDKAEKEEVMAFKINADAVAILAKESAQQKAKFIHISTDYVFNGEGTSPVKEGDKTAPINVYGKSKLEGERLVLQNHPKSIIIRTAWVYSEYGSNFMKTMLRLFSEKKEIGVIDDQQGTPTYAKDLAKAIWLLYQKEEVPAGIYHFTNEGQTTWHGFAQAIKELTKAKIKINKIPTRAYPTPAKRPAYSVMCLGKIKNTLEMEIPQWRESLKKVLLKMEVS